MFDAFLFETFVEKSMFLIYYIFKKKLELKTELHGYFRIPKMLLKLKTTIIGMGQHTEYRIDLLKVQNFMILLFILVPQKK